jgi:thiol:disulfide interchange protein DsbD
VKEPPVFGERPRRFLPTVSRRSRGGAALAGTLLALLASAPGAGVADEPAAPPAEPARARLVADTNAFAPGSTFRLGVLFTIDPHWHIYWHSARDGGLGTEVIWKLPEGWRAGPVEWPAPSRFELPGPLVAYGYEKQVLLQSEITVPPEAPAEPVSLGAELSWLVCKEVCVIGKGSPTLSLPAGAPTPSKEAPGFAASRAQVPLHPVRSGISLEESYEGRTGAGSWRIHLEFPEGVSPPDAKSMRAFPFDPPGGRLDEGRFEGEGRRRTIVFEVEVQSAEFRRERLGAVITWPAPEGGTRPPVAIEVRSARASAK